jgi:hypothetical protein
MRARIRLIARRSHSGLPAPVTASPRLQSRYCGRASGVSIPVTAGIEGLLLRIPGIAIPIMARREKDGTNSCRRSSQKILLSVSAAEPTSGMQGTLTRPERDPCDASHRSSTGRVSERHPSFGRRPRVRQQRIRCLTQPEAGQALSELGKVHRVFRWIRGVGITWTFLHGRDIGLRFAWHPCIASEKKVRQDFGIALRCFKDDAGKTEVRPDLRFGGSPSTNLLSGKMLVGRSRLVWRSRVPRPRCCTTTPATVELPQSARCQEPWHPSIQTVAPFHRCGGNPEPDQAGNLLWCRCLSDSSEGARLLLPSGRPPLAASNFSAEGNG